ncbi:hypothetical protein EDO6_01769 [Paenibacillus xylanexedens]|nr:hypothetical protein EDO6_01769 [Paenibacillus xylanexedens]
MFSSQPRRLKHKHQQAAHPKTCLILLLLAAEGIPLAGADRPKFPSSVSL